MTKKSWADGIGDGPEKEEKDEQPDLVSAVPARCWGAGLDDL